MRAFARVYIIFLPAIFAPYLVHVALETSDVWKGTGTGGHPPSDERLRVAFACVVASTVSVMLAGLYSVALSLENPFRWAPHPRHASPCASP